MSAIEFETKLPVETESSAPARSRSLWMEMFQRLLRNRAAVLGGILVIGLVLIALCAPWIAPRHYSEQTLTDQNKVPAWVASVFPSMKSYAKLADGYLLGTDYVGRDLLSRMVYGARISLLVAFIGPLISLLIGILYGSVAGYFGGRVDNLMMRFVDILYAFPTILFVILLMAFFRSTLTNLQPGTLSYTISELDTKMGGMLFIIVGLGFTSWETMARLTRGQVLSMREKEFVEAARTGGASDLRIVFRHILPNIIGPLIVAETLAIPSYISFETFLSFIGLGVNPPMPSWGSMIADGSSVIRTYPNQAIFPALALAITMLAFNFLGDGLRDALDPRLRGTQ